MTKQKVKSKKSDKSRDAAAASSSHDSKVSFWDQYFRGAFLVDFCIVVPSNQLHVWSRTRFCVLKYFQENARISMQSSCVYCIARSWKMGQCFYYQIEMQTFIAHDPEGDTQ